jgi:hypothetical protein
MEIIQMPSNEIRKNRFIFIPEIFDSVYLASKRKRNDKASNFTYVRTEVNDIIQELKILIETENKYRREMNSTSNIMKIISSAWRKHCQIRKFKIAIKLFEEKANQSRRSPPETETNWIRNIKTEGKRITDKQRNFEEAQDQRT